MMIFTFLAAVSLMDLSTPAGGKGGAHKRGVYPAKVWGRGGGING